MREDEYSGDDMAETSGDRRYRIGEVVSEMGLSQYTLKFYEREGLIVPKTNEETGYRYYDYRDYGRLIFIRNYRRMGFSTSEIVDLIRHQDVAGNYENFKRKSAENLSTIRELEQANRLLEYRCGILERYLQNEDGEEILNIPSARFYRHFEGDRLSDSIEDYSGTDGWKNTYEQTMVGTRIKLDHFLADEHFGLEWGLISQGWDIGGLSDAEDMGDTCVEFPGGEMLVVYRFMKRIEEQTDVLYPLIRDVLAQKGCTATGDILTFYPTVTRDGEDIYASSISCIPIF